MEKLTESLETYLTAVFDLLEQKNTIKVKDIANYLDIGGPSTADAIKKLQKKGFINYVPYGDITLTGKGIELVTLKKYRHNTIVKFLNKVLNIQPDEAEKNAKAVEYSMTQDVLIKFVAFLDFMEQCSCKEPKWVKSCQQTLKNGKLSQNCQSCISKEGGCCCNNKVKDSRSE